MPWNRRPGKPRLNPAQKHLLKTWIAAILWLGIIVTESTNLASADNTGEFFTRCCTSSLAWILRIFPSGTPSSVKAATS